MKISIVLRGISYLENYLHKYNLKLYTIDFRDTFLSFKKNVVEPYLKKGYEVDIFISTYNNKYNVELLEMYKPVKYNFIDYEQIPLGESQQIIGEPMIIDQIKNCINMIEEHEKEKNFLYDFVIITRFDLYFYQNIDDIFIDFNNINLLFYHITKERVFSSEDNFIFYPRNKQNLIKYCLEKLKKDVKSSHILGKYLIINGETIKYLFGEKGEGSYDYPFYKFGRHIFGNAKEYTIEQILNIKMNKIYNSNTKYIDKNNLYFSN